MSALRLLAPDGCRFSRGPGGTLRAEIDGLLSCRQAVLRRLFPIRDPDRFISVSDGKEEVGIIADLGAFDAETRRIVREELDLFYAVPEIVEIEELKEEYGYYHWKTRTDRGPREFYVKGRTESVRFSPPAQLLIVDIHKSRYRIADAGLLPRASRRLLDQVY